MPFVDPNNPIMTIARPPEPRFRSQDDENRIPDVIIQGIDTENETNITYLLYYWYKAHQSENDNFKVLRIATEIDQERGNIITKKYPSGCSGYNYSIQDVYDHINNLVNLDFKFEY